MNRARYVAHAGVIAAVHAAITLAVLQMPAQLGWGPVQFRVSEAFTVLALFTPAAIPGLALGTAVANGFMVAQVGPVGLLDVVFGALATLLGAAWTWRFRSRRLVALAGPVLSNALIVPAYLPFILAALGLTQEPILGIDAGTGWPLLYGLGVLTVGFGQLVVVYGIGVPLASVLDRTGLGRDLVTGAAGKRGGVVRR